MSVCYGGMGGKKALKHDDTSFFFFWERMS